ncbi:MAG: hypothetical protein WD844_10510 [Thermoleophilaceae bacterium]
MTTAIRLGLYAALLAVLAGGAALLGGALDPDARGEEPEASHASSEAGSRETGDASHPATAGADQPRGLAVASGGLRLVAEGTELARGRDERFRFRIVDARDRTVTNFDVEHERRMHLIVVRRDLSGYQHLHPRQARDGSWEVELRLPEAGAYRVYADFTRGGEAQTLGIDVNVPGRFTPRELPHPATTASAGDGYEVELDETDGELRFTVHKDGRLLSDIEPYLGARGHLVALRDGDLAYLHVHPESDATAGRDIRFAVEYPSKGRYGLFLQFKHEGRVQTAVFTRDTDGTQEGTDGHGH